VAQVAKRGGELAEVAEFQSAFAETASGDDGDGVCRAAVDLDVSDHAFAIHAGGIFDAQQPHAVNGKPQPENLAGAEMAVSRGGKRFVFGQRFHGSWRKRALKCRRYGGSSTISRPRMASLR